MSSTGDANFFSVLTMLCGTSSRFVQVTVAPAGTVAAAGEKLKLSTTDLAPIGAGRRHGVLERQVGDGNRVVDVVVGDGREAEHLVSADRASTFIGPGDGAAPGAGCGNAVDIAVWNVTFPSTFCIT